MSSSSSSCALGEQESLILGVARAVRRRAEVVRSRGDVRGDMSLALAETYPDFAETHPMLFLKCCDTTFPLDKLEWMLRHLSAVKAGDSDKDSSRAAVVGALQQQYMAPAVEAAERRRLNGGGGGNDADDDLVQ